MSTSSATAAEPIEVKRRDFLYIATGAVAAVGAAAAVWPLIDQMNPAADVLAAGGPLTVDLSSVAPGQQIVVMWRSKPIFVVHRTPENLTELKSPALLARLRDPNSDELQQPAYAKNWSRSLKPDYLVLVGICTHLGCIPGYEPKPGSISASWPGGYLCPCHGSKYDMAGRVYQNVPAPMNLPVPPYHFASATKLVVGENPPGETFTMSEVETM
ncbi:MAG: ubiquinol-cytochrome c reductase iron-sulfur subunit [Alphaproteobacteria bacterium]|nr:ubiquinol-cytochrome c reductase iron-sulfur subunit [Alphaproteobacteria bacterium]MBU6474153.1 ubiquinol-cytochrome c reductase iron-sulfur subunit [Alphaproteobacteria bacterium]MDE2011407.1 ubiquinol-cytochrome c reductase iron-sulfur subunit [Alphaproteobacteria bacterium]MDE2071798.1 ubiquinol-cytochrome c reductase iron-sulfur subunit [Alphaproteobacteria bacterium]MDE2350404.1 ubiquinol-cytochrome c reductase iron-sulfur subunit [Alphaproteobacteria bacterium]